VHSLEHGAVVISYNCTDCADEVAAVQEMIDGLPTDPLCGAFSVDRRVILLPDPLLDVRWAASAWLWTLRGDCLELGALEDFYLAHFGQGPENFCNDGAPFTDSNGGSTVTPGCGE
jgi:hypothetical protein